MHTYWLWQAHHTASVCRLGDYEDPCLVDSAPAAGVKRSPRVAARSPPQRMVRRHRIPKAAIASALSGSTWHCCGCAGQPHPCNMQWALLHLLGTQDTKQSRLTQSACRLRSGSCTRWSRTRLQTWCRQGTASPSSPPPPTGRPAGLLAAGLGVAEGLAGPLGEVSC